MRFAIGQVAHETNTFAKDLTTKDIFEMWEWSFGKEVLDNHKGVGDYLGGMIHECEQSNVEIEPTFAAFAYPSGIIAKETYDLIQQNLIESIKLVGDVDAICLSLHGAGVTENTDDLEGTLLKDIRAELGYEVPIIATLDLHSNVTETMVSEADLLLGVNYYPHTDSAERGKEAIELAIKIVNKEILPNMHLTKLPLMIPTSTTNLFPAKDINEICWKYECDENVIDCTFFHGFPYTNIEQVGVSILTTTDNDKSLAKYIADKIAAKVWAKRKHFFPNVLSPKQGIEKALQTEGEPVIINETSDNPGGGTPGDGTHLLREMLTMNIENSCFGYIFDPEAAEIAHQEGVGSYINIKLGGKTDDLHGKPLNVNGYVKSLTDGFFYQSSPMWRGMENNLGKSARIKVNGVDIVICSVKSQILDEQIFLLHGIDISECKIVALKSSVHFRAAFEPISKEIITVDSPGLSSIQLSNFNRTKLKDKVYPFYNIEFTASQKS